MLPLTLGPVTSVSFLDVHMHITMTMPIVVITAAVSTGIRIEHWHSTSATESHCAL